MNHLVPSSPKRRKLSISASPVKGPCNALVDFDHNQHDDQRAQVDRLAVCSPKRPPMDAEMLDIPFNPSIPTVTLVNNEPAIIPSKMFRHEPTDPELCFGMIVDAKLKPLGRRIIPKSIWATEVPPIGFRIRFRTDAVTALLPTLEEFGVLDCRTALILTTLIKDNPTLQFEAFPDLDQSPQPTRKQEITSVLPLTINVYGPTASLDKVAFALSGENIFLQEPTHFHPTSTYHNPHFLSWEDDMMTPQLKRQCLPNSVNLAAEVETILEQSSIITFSTYTGQDYRIRTSLHDHQLAALQFMVARENAYVHDENISLWRPKYRSGREVFVHTITGEQQEEKPSETRGGIIADIMGTALYNWQLEIRKHLDPDVLKIHLYHGTGTATDSRVLENSDIVLTTYETTSSDYSKNGILRNIPWFRIVMDEGMLYGAQTLRGNVLILLKLIAHHIRNRSTKAFEAIMALQAERRWCLTGTPVQNKLDDLFSLTEFLRFHPVENPQNARKYIMEPLGRRDEQALKDLRSIMRTISLRRTKTACHQRRRSEVVETVVLSSAEREQYDLILTRTKEMLADFNRSGPSHILLRSILQLRQICSHGASATSPSIYHSQSSGGLPLCNRCGDSLPLQPKQTGSLQGAFRDQVCYDCSLDWNNNGPNQTANSPASDWSTDDDDMQHDILTEMMHAKSSKLNRVLSKLIDLEKGSSDKQAPVKSLVFSCWTTTLDRLGSALENYEMRFVRIDGSQSLNKRATTIDQFRSEPDLRIMLLSTACGSVGLNLTAASHVHLVEPQWNPMVEAQAAARVDRLDQTQDVVIIRYVVEKSIEERIRARQRNKIMIADLSVSQTTSTSNDAHDSVDLMSLEALL